MIADVVKSQGVKSMKGGLDSLESLDIFCLRWFFQGFSSWKMTFRLTWIQRFGAYKGLDLIYIISCSFLLGDFIFIPLSLGPSKGIIMNSCRCFSRLLEGKFKINKSRFSRHAAWCNLKNAS